MSRVKRIEWVDTVKYVCIIMVMLSHLETCTDIWRAFFTPFFLSAFFFTSGYVYKPKGYFKDFLYTKFRQLFVPWLIFSILNIVLSHILTFNSHVSLVEELKWNFLQIRGQGDQIWFVAALFVAFIPFYYFVKWDEDLHKSSGGGYRSCALFIQIAWLLSFISILYTRLAPKDFFPWKSTALPWHLEYIFQAVFFMLLGYLFHQRWERLFDKHNTLNKRIIAVSVYLLMVFIPFFSGIKMPMVIDILYDYVSSLTGIAALVSVAKVVKATKYVNYIGQNTLICFALHGKVLSLIQSALRETTFVYYTRILEDVVASSIFCLVLSLVISFALIIPVFLVNRWFPFILGRANNKK